MAGGGYEQDVPEKAESMMCPNDVGNADDLRARDDARLWELFEIGKAQFTPSPEYVQCMREWAQAMNLHALGLVMAFAPRRVEEDGDG